MCSFVGRQCRSTIRQAICHMQATNPSDTKQLIKIEKKSNIHYTRGITPKRVTSGGLDLRGLTREQHSSEEMSQRWRAVGETVPI